MTFVRYAISLHNALFCLIFISLTMSFLTTSGYVAGIGLGNLVEQIAELVFYITGLNEGLNGDLLSVIFGMALGIAGFFASILSILYYQNPFYLLQDKRHTNNELNEMGSFFGPRAKPGADQRKALYNRAPIVLFVVTPVIGGIAGASTYVLNEQTWWLGAVVFLISASIAVYAPVLQLQRWALASIGVIGWGALVGFLFNNALLGASMAYFLFELLSFFPHTRRVLNIALFGKGDIKRDLTMFRYALSSSDHDNHYSYQAGPLPYDLPAGMDLPLDLDIRGPESKLLAANFWAQNHVLWCDNNERYQIITPQSAHEKIQAESYVQYLWRPL